MAICPSFIGAQVLRVTRLDQCGRPVYGDCSQVVSSGFVSVEISPEVQEGEDYTQRNAAGDLCVSERGQDVLQWFTVSIEFCQVDPALFNLMNPSWQVVEDAFGEPVGFRIGTQMSDRLGFALELWPKTSSQGNLCPEDAPDDAQPSGYFLLPYVIGTAPESWTLEDGVATFTLNGRTKGGSQWGRGPYQIRHDAQGNPDFLADPINDGADDNNPTHFHAEIVTLAPPTSACGCQPLEAIAPSAEGGQVTIDPEQANLACFTVAGSAARQVTIDWGDDTDPVTSRVGREECHTYTATGTYTVTVSDIDDAELSNTYEVTVEEIPPLPAPELTANPTSGEPPLEVTLSVNNHDNGQVVIDWGDGTDPETVDGGTQASPAVYTHTYTEGAVDPYALTVTSVQDETATATEPITVSLPDIPAPDLAVEPQQGEAPLEVTATINNNDNGQVTVDFGDGSQVQTVDGGDEAAPAQVEHTYAEQGTYTVTVAPVDNPTATATTDVVVTGPADPPTVNATQADDSLQVSALVDNHGNGPVDVDFGDGSEPVTNPGDSDTPAEHTYTEAGTYTISATSQANPDLVGSTDIDVVDPAGQVPAITATPTSGTAPVEVSFVVDNHGNGPVTIDFGDGSETATNPGDGEEATTHTYTDEGTVTATATSDADESLSDSVDIEIDAPAPDPEPVAPPADVLVTDPAVDGFTLTWDWEQGEGPAATEFTTRYRTPAQTGDWEQGPAATAQERTVDITGLEADTEYEVEVTAVAEDTTSDPATATGSTAQE